MSKYFNQSKWKRFLNESNCGAKYSREPEQFQDHEGEMARSQLLQIIQSASALMNMIEEGDELPAWVQSKLTKAADYLKAAEGSEEYDELSDMGSSPCGASLEEGEVEEGKICDKGIQYVMRTDPGGKDIHRGDDGKLKNWSARAAQLASKKCKDPDFGTGKSKKKKNEASMEEAEGGLKAWEKENWTHSDGTPCGGGKKDGSQSRCKPASKWKGMSKGEKAADNAKKKAGTKAGKQYVPATKKGKVTKSHTKR